MPDAIYADPRLVRVYDAFDGARDDLDGYAALAGEREALRIIDIGCGTGTLAVRLAQEGRQVVGVDPAQASLDLARTKDGAGHVIWLERPATELPATDADLAVMTGNVGQVFITDEEWWTVLRSVHDALRPGGLFVFESRRLEDRAWERWALAADESRDVRGVGLVTRSITVTAVTLPLVSFRHTYTFAADESVVVSDSTLRFRGRRELEGQLTVAGFRVVEFRDAPDRPGREWVVLAERA